MTTPKVKRTSWSKPVDLTAALAGTPVRRPKVCRWPEGKRALFYPNEVHSVGGEPEAMKSWLVLLGAAQEIDAGNHVIYADMESNDLAIVDRLQLLGCTDDQIQKCFHYLRPDAAMTGKDRKRFRKMVVLWKPTLVVLDGVTEAYALHGYSVNAAEDAAMWFQRFARQFQLREPLEGYPGPAIVELDHVVKDRDSRGHWTIGSQHKKAGIKGAMYILESSAAFGRGRHGRSRILLAKDSPGGVEWVRGKRMGERYVAHLHCISTKDANGWSVDAWLEVADPSDEQTAPREDVAAVEKPEFQQWCRDAWVYVRDHPRVSGKTVRAKVRGIGDKAKQDALAVMEDDGYLVNAGASNSAKWEVGIEFRLLKPVGDEA